jgi:hypothetical protein
MDVKVLCNLNTDFRVIWMKNVPEDTSDITIKEKFLEIFTINSPVEFEIERNTEIPFDCLHVWNWSNI